MPFDFLNRQRGGSRLSPFMRMYGLPPRMYDMPDEDEGNTPYNPFVNFMSFYGGRATQAPQVRNMFARMFRPR